MNKRSFSQVKIGALLSYLLVVLNALYGLVLTPMIIAGVGVGDYGVYKTITSFTAALIVLDLGIGSTVQRYIASFLAKKENDKISNFMAMSLIVGSILCASIFLIFFVLYFFINPLFGDTFTNEQIILAKEIFCISAITVLLRVYENAFHGLITGFNRFIVGNGISLVSLIIRIGLLIVYLQFFNDVKGIAIINLIAGALVIIVEIIYVKYVLKIKIKYSKWDFFLFKEAGKYTLLMFITSIVTQITSNLDNQVIGSIRGPEFVTVYSVGLLIFSMFSQISSSISGVMLPTVTNVLNSKDGEIKIRSIIIKAGRIQFILLGACIVGFVCIGQEFVSLWMGEGFEDVYVITIILIVPAIFELCINTCLAILRAKNLLGFRTVALVISTALNLIVTIILVKYWSYIGAAIGTSVTYILYSLIAMNIYYIKKLQLPMFEIYKGIIGKTWICLLIAGGALYFVSKMFHGSWISLIINIGVFCFVYGLSLLLFGLNKKEKEYIKKKFCFK